MNTQLLAVLDDSNTVVARFEYAGGCSVAPPSRRPCLRADAECAGGRMPVAMVQGEEVYYLAYDQVGSLRAVYTAAGDVVRTVEYDAWGNILFEFSAPGYESLKVPFGFAGGLHDRDTGLVLFGLRNYDPETGRWTSRDPIGLAGGDTDLYAYCGNDPVGKADPSGLSDINLPVSPWGPGGAYFPTLPRIEFSFPDLLAWHYDRNNWGADRPISRNEAREMGWKNMLYPKNLFHTMGPGNEANWKYVSPDGSQEAVFNAAGDLVTDPMVMGTYNYGRNPLSRFCFDMMPYYFLGNSRDDPTYLFERLSGMYWDFGPWETGAPPTGIGVCTTNSK